MFAAAKLFRMLAGLCGAAVAGAALAVSATVQARPLFSVFAPQGPVANTQRNLIVIDTVIMLAIVVPTIVMAVIVLRRYRAGNRRAAYAPDWARSLKFEIPMWGVPILAVGGLAYFVVTGSIASDPYHPAVLDAAPENALHVQVISLDWRWLFIYPDQHIATLGTLTIPTHRQIQFSLTASAASNSFFIPRLAGQIYVMPARKTRLVLKASHTGDYHGFSALQSGAGFSWMDFTTHAVTASTFRRWVDKTQNSNKQLTRAKFEQLAKPTIAQGRPPQRFGAVAPGLFHHVIKQVKNGKVYPTPLFAGKKMAEGKPLEGAAAG